jgi:hypothetical protein
VEILPSAHRHGIASEDIHHAVQLAVAFYEVDDELTMAIGPARDGTPLEVGIARELYIVHAMKARPRFLPKERH